MTVTAFLLLFQLKVLLTHTDWISPASTLIRSDDQFAVGAYNGSIFLVGGFNYEQQITEYRIETDTFLNIGETVLSNYIWGSGQFWSQKEEIIYIVGSQEPYLSTFNMKNQQYTANWKNIEVDVDRAGCVAISNDNLYVVGGFYMAGDTLQIMNLATFVWINNVNPPTLNQRREGHACIVYYDHLWVFGGYNSDDTHIQSNERINIIDITSNHWSYIEPLSAAAIGLRATSWHHTIFIIGGWSGSIHVDTVHIVDALTGNVTVSPDRLVYPIVYPGVLITNNIIYVFGGTNQSMATNQWMQYKLEITNTAASTVTTTEYETTIQTTNAPVSSTQYLTSMIKDGTTTPISYHSQAPTQYNASIHTTDTSDPSSMSKNTLTVTERATLTTIFKSHSSKNSSHLIVYIAAIIASFCVCCLCILLIWKSFTQKAWDPEPHDTAGDRPQLDEQYLDDEDDEDDENEEQENGLQMIQIKRLSSISLDGDRTIEGAQKVLRDKPLEIECNDEAGVHINKGIDYEDRPQLDEHYLDDEEDENEEQENGLQMIQMKRLSSISLDGDRTIEGEQNVLRDKPLEIDCTNEAGVHINEGIDYEETKGTMKTTHTQTCR